MRNAASDGEIHHRDDGRAGRPPAEAQVVQAWVVKYSLQATRSSSKMAWFAWWTGRGLWALPIMLAFFIFPLCLGVGLTNAYPNAISPMIVPLFTIAGFAVGGVVCWKFGRSLNRGKSRGQYHTLYSVRVEHWGVVYIALAVLLSLLLLVALLWRFFR
jgi:hypothetical protein